jgi:hypothetical protein
MFKVVVSDDPNHPFINIIITIDGEIDCHEILTSCYHDFIDFLQKSLLPRGYKLTMELGSLQGMCTIRRNDSYDLEIFNQTTRVKHDFTKEEADNLLCVLKSNIDNLQFEQKPQPTPSLSSSKPQKQNNQFVVIIDNDPDYPVNITTIIQGTTECYTISEQVALDLIDFLQKPLGPLNFEDTRFPTGQGKCQFGLTTGGLVIQNLDTGILCLFDKRDTNDLLCSLRTAMQNHSINKLIKSSVPVFGAAPTEPESSPGTDPMAGAKRRTDDNLRSMFE